MTAGLPTISPLPPPNWNRSLFDWIIKSSITFVWLFVVRAENAMMGGVQCFLSPPKPSSTSCSGDRNWNWTLFNWAGELSTPKLKPKRLNEITVMEISQSINHFREHWLYLKWEGFKGQNSTWYSSTKYFYEADEYFQCGKTDELVVRSVCRGARG